MFHRWGEVTKRLRLDVTIQELTDDGVYDNVEIISNPEVSTIGVFQLKQVSFVNRHTNEIKILHLQSYVLSASHQVYPHIHTNTHTF